MAGRKDKNIVDYFPHFCIPGKTLFILESKFGHLGYSVWFKSLELLGSTDNHYIDLRDDTDLLFLISKLKTTESDLIEIYDLMAKLGAIDSYFWSKKIIYSENFIKNIEDVYKRRSNSCMHKCDLCKHLRFSCGKNDNKCGQKLTKESKVKETKVKEPLNYYNIKKAIWDSWVKYKSEQFKFKYKSLESEQLAINNLVKLSGNNEINAGKIVQQSISNGWKGLFEMKNSNNYQEQKHIYTPPKNQIL